MIHHQQQQQQHSSQLSAMPCFMVNELTSDSLEQCKFIIDNDCLEDDASIDFVYLVYCEFGHELIYVSIVLIIFVAIVLFLALSSVADKFLCPSLLAVAKNLRMSDSLAGVTLLAFGNACPDIFSSIAAASDDRPELIVGELLGAGIFCTSIVAGLIFIHSDFKLACRPTLRDTMFYLCAVYLVWSFCWDQQITFYGSLSFILIYVIYLVVALSGQAIYSRLLGNYPVAETQQQQRTITDLERSASGDENDCWYSTGDECLRIKQIRNIGRPTADEKQLPIDAAANGCSTIFGPQNYGNNQTHSHPLGTSIVKQTPNGKTNIIISGGSTISCGQPSIVHLELTKQAVIRLEQSQQQQQQKEKKQHPIVDQGHQLTAVLDTLEVSTEWEQFLAHINPIDNGEWNQSGPIGKVATLLGAPLMFIALLTVPVVDAEKPNSNWCRLLSVLHCITVPMAISSLFKFGPASEYACLFGLPMPIVAIIPGACLAIFVYKTSHPDEPPRYHPVFAYFGFIMSVLWIYTLASEIISLLKTIGIIFSMSDTAIGLGILAWGNSLGDIVANISLAEAGHSRMAIGASIGAPLLNLLLGFGISISLNLKPGQVLPIEYSPTITLLCSTLAIILLSLMLSTLAPADRSKKPFGYLLIGCYCVYFILAICLEYKFIKVD